MNGNIKQGKVRASGYATPLLGTLELADKCRLAACAKVDDYGFVRDVCGAPVFDKPGIAPEGQAFFMLVHAAYSHVRA